MGMGGEILLVDREHLPEKRRLIFDFTDGTCLAVNFWWFGFAHYLPPGPLEAHEQLAKLGPNVLDVDFLSSARSCAGQKGGVKAFLLDQSRLAGIGNAYIHDILWLARIHPLRKLNTPVGLRRSTRCGRASRTACGPAWQRAARSTRWGCPGRRAAS